MATSSFSEDFFVTKENAEKYAAAFDEQGKKKIKIETKADEVPVHEISEFLKRAKA